MRNKWLVCCLLGLIGCHSTQDHAPWSRLPALYAPEPIPQREPLSPRGNPDSYVVHGQRYFPLKTARGYRETGLASWYGMQFHGRDTAMGEPYDVYQLTAAHRTLPLPTYLRVTHLHNQKSIIVRVNDRGPFHPERILDLSYAAAVQLGIDQTGTALVRIEAVTPEERGPITSMPNSWSIYLGQFKNAHLARQTVYRLKRYTKAHIQLHQGYYRLVLGPYHQHARAVEMLQRLQALGFRDAQMVP